MNKLWIIQHPRLLYLAILPAMIAGYSLGFAAFGFWGFLFCGPICLMVALFAYGFFRVRLLRTLGGEMIEAEARQMLHEHVHHWEQRGYDALSRLAAAKHIETFVQTGRSGAVYQIEIELFWDSTPGGAVRVASGIDDGGVRAFAPLCVDTLVHPAVAMNAAN